MLDVHAIKHADTTGGRLQLLQSIMPLVPHLPSFGQNSRQLLETLGSIITDVDGDEQVPAMSSLRWTNAAVLFDVLARNRSNVNSLDGGSRSRCCWS